MTTTSMQRFIVPAIQAYSNITPAGAIGTVIVLIVVADPIGFRDKVFETVNKLIEFRYSVVVDARRRKVAVGPELA